MRTDLQSGDRCVVSGFPEIESVILKDVDLDPILPLKSRDRGTIPVWTCSVKNYKEYGKRKIKVAENLLRKVK